MRGEYQLRYVPGCETNRIGYDVPSILKVHADDIVTVGIPFADEPIAYLEMAIRSVFAQTYTNWRLILVGDSAPQSSIDRLAQIADPRVRLIVGARREGLAARLNQIAREAETPLLARMDADDVMHPERLEIQVAHFAEPIDLLGSRAIATDESGRLIGLLREPSLPREPAGFLKSHAFTHPTVIGRTAWFRANPYREDFRRAEDKELWLRVSASAMMRKTEDVVLFYRVPALSARKQAMDSKADRMVIAEFGPGYIGKFATYRAQLRSHIRQRLFAVLVRAGMGDDLRTRRTLKVAATDRMSFDAALKSVGTTTVPGWAS